MKRICLLSILQVRGISPVFADIYFAKILHSFHRTKNLRTAARNLFNICRSQLYIPHSVTKVWLLIRGISPVFADIYIAKIFHSIVFIAKKIVHCRATFSTFARVNFIHHSGTMNLATDSTVGIFSLAALLFPKFLKVKCSSPPPPLINAPFSAVSAHH